ncbi:MAG: PD40 domain-containing protein [Halobacteriovoraceae bacterium]|nr:PD40 domain-containing protein [Halobacteriovoraceae bacterium]MCB9093980.1 PD40 domain-containing protein [Halobacteriovoraceae bacterium]
MNWLSIVLVIITLNPGFLSAQNFTAVSVGQAEKINEKILINQVECEGVNTSQAPRVKESISKVSEIVKNNFLFYKTYFPILYRETNASIAKSIDLKKNFVKDSVKFLLEVTCSESSKTSSVSLTAYDLKEEKLLASEEISFESVDDRHLVHKASNTLFKAITGQESLFLSRIVFVSDEKSGLKNKLKELYIMDFDGRGVKKLTSHKGIVLSPAFSPDGNKILYSLIDVKSKSTTIALYEMDLIKKTIRIVSNEKGINSGAVYASDGKGIYLTLSHGSNAEIYYMELATKKLRKVTSNYAVDVDPSINREGNLLAFLSGRAGRAMIYTLNPIRAEYQVKRISYVGQFNATPRFSPDGSEIVFASWMDNTFDLFRLASSGHSLVRLTKNFGSNEDPSYSPDGQFIVFSSKRVISRVKADQNLYIMDRDGEILGQLTYNLGNCSSPRFSK